MNKSESIAWIEQHFEVHEGFPRPDWAAIEEHIEKNFDEPKRNEAWPLAVDEWLNKIIEALGEGYWLGESKNFLIVANESEQYLSSLARFLENTLDTILTTLNGIASGKRYGKHVVMIFHSADQYYSYISYFYPEEGEFASSGGIYVNKGYGHFALPSAGLLEAESVVAHELTHACLDHLTIPSWLNEGITQIMEYTITLRNPLDVDSEMMDRHQRFWGEEEVQQFWSGDSFLRPDEGCELSYHLARLAVGALSHNYDTFKDFVLRADYRDGGEAAAKEVLGGSLGGLMEQFLGPGNWRPTPETWPDIDRSEISLFRYLT